MPSIWWKAAAEGWTLTFWGLAGGFNFECIGRWAAYVVLLELLLNLVRRINLRSQGWDIVMYIDVSQLAPASWTQQFA